MTTTAQRPGVAGIFEARDAPMAACESKWLTRFKRVPANAAIPLAMSGSHPRATGSYGAECVKWAKSELGITLRWWQALAITRQLEHDKAGTLVWREVIESGPRRIGKSTRLRVVALWRLAHAEKFHEPQLAMLVSKDLAVGKEIHSRSWRWCETKNWNVVRLNGAQEVESPKGDRWLLRAPNAAYGYDVGYGQVDESWDVDPMAITDGLEPALLERHSPQLHLTSTAHVRASSLMRRRLLAALRNADPDVLLLLWGAHPDADWSDEATWRTASPHWSQDRRDLMARKYAAALAGQDEPEFDDPDPVRGWGAQYLNSWPLLGSAPDEMLPEWEGCADSSLNPVVTCIAAAVSFDRRYASIGAAGMNGDHAVIGAVDRRPGVGWLIPELKRIQDERGCPVVVDERGPTADLIPAMWAAGIDVALAKTSDILDASANLFDRVQQHALSHPGHPELDLAVSLAAKRNVGDRWTWARKTSAGDISMLEAVTLALWGAANATGPLIFT